MKLLEDCSPYFMRIKHAGIDQIQKICLDFRNTQPAWPPNHNLKGMWHLMLPKKETAQVLELIPFTSHFDFMPDRVSLFVTRPGYYYRAHKDGMNLRFGLNYTISIKDKVCETCWYSDSDGQQYLEDNLQALTGSKISREAAGFKKESHVPLKSMVAQEGECILFNTEIYHDFDNSKSNNERIVLTLRNIDPEGKIYFEDAKKIIQDNFL